MSQHLSSLFSRARRFLPPSAKEKIKKYRYTTAAFFLRLVEPLIGRFVTFHTRPIYSKDVLLSPGEIAREYGDFAIVMQGPLLTRYDFTLETLRLYKRYFPKATLVVTTWEGEDPHTLEGLRREGIEVILNKKPKDPGPNNINLQIMSAQAGLYRAQTLRKTFALKTRTDVRLYHHGSLAFLSDMLRRFPLDVLDYVQKGRLISTHGSITKPYFFADMMVFGYTEDVLRYFSPPLLPHKTTSLPFGPSTIPFVPEQYFFISFLQRIGRRLLYTHEDSLHAQAAHVLVIDPASVDWFWCKYDRHHEYRHLTYPRRKRILEFSDWLALRRADA